jgi:hypothetical protein
LVQSSIQALDLALRGIDLALSGIDLAVQAIDGAIILIRACLQSFQFLGISVGLPFLVVGEFCFILFLGDLIPVRDIEGEYGTDVLQLGRAFVANVKHGSIRVRYWLKI